MLVIRRKGNRQMLHTLPLLEVPFTKSVTLRITCGLSVFNIRLQESAQTEAFNINYGGKFNIHNLK